MILQSGREGQSSANSFGTSAEPVLLTEKQQELCRRLDEFYPSANKTDVRASDLFRGALYAMQLTVRSSNPDWMAQAAHSLRDLIYPFYKSNPETKKERCLYIIWDCWKY